MLFECVFVKCNKNLLLKLYHSGMQFHCGKYEDNLVKFQAKMLFNEQSDV